MRAGPKFKPPRALYRGGPRWAEVGRASEDLKSLIELQPNECKQTSFCAPHRQQQGRPITNISKLIGPKSQITRPPLLMNSRH